MLVRIRAALTLQRWLVLVGCAVFFTIVFAKLWTIRSYGSDLPYWDQWDSEWSLLLLPWQRGELSWENFYLPHNEHRIAFTKALSLAVVSLNGQWDVRLQLCVNALLHAGIAVGLFLWLASLLRTKPVLVALWGMALLIGFAVPHSMENTLSGFHSQQYFLIGLSLIGVERALRCRPWSVGWWAGMLALTLALVTMGSGLLAAAAVIIVILFFHGLPIDRLRSHWPTLLCCAAICAAGVAIKVDAPHHEFLHAHSFRVFFEVIAGYLSWPATPLSVFAILNCVPIVLLAAEVIKRRLDSGSKEMALVAFCVWVIIQIAASAYARGGQGIDPASRYVDTLVLGLIVNFAAGLLLVAQSDHARLRRNAILAGLAVWCVLAGWGMAHRVHELFAVHYPLRTLNLRRCEENVRLYLATGDAAHLKESDIPYPSVEELKERLSHREIDDLLPVSVRPAIKIEADQMSGFGSGRISSRTKAFAFAENFGSFPEAITGTWVSRPIALAQNSFLKFEMAGNTGDPEIALELWTEDMKTKLASIAPSKIPHDSWRAAYARAPRERFRIVARDSSSTAWMAFAAPATLATGSYWCWRLTEHARLLFWCSLTSFALCLGIAFIMAMRRVSFAPVLSIR